MKKCLPLTLLLLAVGLTAPLRAETSPKTDKEKLGYSLGVDVAQTLKKQPFEFDQAQFQNGIRDVLAGGQRQMTEEQVQATLAAFSRDLQAKGQAAAASKGKAAGEAFLAANKSKPGVQTLPDGLQYKVIQEGSGPLPKANDNVTVKYRGTLIDGTEFDASEKHGGTANFEVDKVIPGWTEALQKMKVGSKWQLFIPSELAYGDRAMGTEITPGSTLIFDVELVSIGK